MNVLSLMRTRFDKALGQLVDDPSPYLDMIKPSQDVKFGDYQANCAMPLKARLNENPRDIAARIVEHLDVEDICEPPEIAGPGFINLRLKDDWIIQQLQSAQQDDRLGVSETTEPKTYVIDYSAPNVAKPMHVGHIRSTVIGDALCRILRFLGHRVISDNHLGDWGTQFGMIIYGYKNFADEQAYQQHPVRELARLYRLVSQLCGYHDATEKIVTARQELEDRGNAVKQIESQPQPEEKSAKKQLAKELRAAKSKLGDAREQVESLQDKIGSIEKDTSFKALADGHPRIGSAVLEETAKLHAGDKENLRLWHEFLPNCRDEIQRVYSRLDIHFDHEYGESHYHDRLLDVVADFASAGLSKESDGATCVFLDGFDAPMIIRKRDGAFLYATTDLATIRFRMETWNPDAILYVVDHRQAEHFDKLFAAARLWGYEDVELQHVRFGTVMGPDGKPYKTRSGDTVGLEGLLDTAVAKAHEVVANNDDERPSPALSNQQRREVAYVVGHSAIKYSDLSHNREADYKFDEDKMVALKGDTATYMQYSYARVLSIYERGDVDADQIRQSAPAIVLGSPAERAMALEILRFEEALRLTTSDYRPNHLTGYLFELAQVFSKFFDKCPVLKAETDELKQSRLALCDLTRRTIKQGLNLLGIGVDTKM